jgi:hypothetical protein
MSRSSGSRVAAALTFGSFAFVLSPAHGAESASQACIAAHADGLAQRDAGRLFAARELFLSCAEERCPLEVRKTCATLCDEVVAATPSVVLVATDERGGDLGLARAAIDGRATDPQASLAIELDPGKHTAEFQLLDGRRQRTDFVLRAGEKYRRIVAVFEAQQTLALADVTAAPHRRSALPYFLGGVGLLALGGFAYFALDGQSQENQLDECKPTCTRAGVDNMRLAYLLADVSLGVALASFSVGGYLYFRDSGTSPGSGTAFGLTVHRGF